MVKVMVMVMAIVSIITINIVVTLTVTDGGMAAGNALTPALKARDQAGRGPASSGKSPVSVAC